MIPGEKEIWQDKALCAQTDPELFFPNKGEKASDAKRVCMACEVRAECLEFALWETDHWGRHLDGVWGGLSHDQRKKLRHRLRKEAS